jgi:hypothetical protein
MFLVPFSKYFSQRFFFLFSLRFFFLPRGKEVESCEGSDDVDGQCSPLEVTVNVSKSKGRVASCCGSEDIFIFVRCEEEIVTRHSRICRRRDCEIRGW